MVAFRKTWKTSRRCDRRDIWRTELHLAESHRSSADCSCHTPLPVPVCSRFNGNARQEQFRLAVRIPNPFTSISHIGGYLDERLRRLVQQSVFVDQHIPMQEGDFVQEFTQQLLVFGLLVRNVGNELEPVFALLLVVLFPARDRRDLAKRSMARREGKVA